MPDVPAASTVAPAVGSAPAVPQATVPHPQQLPVPSSPPNHRRIPWLTIILGTVFGILIGLNMAAVYVFLLKPKKAAQTAVHTDVPAWAVLPSNAPVAGEHFADTAPTDPNWKSFTTGWNFSVTYPATWSVAAATSADGPTYVFGERPTPLGDSDNGTVGLIYVDIFGCLADDTPVPCKTALAQTVNNQKKYMDDFTQSPVTVMGRDAIRIRGTSQNRTMFPEGTADMTYVQISGSHIALIAQSLPRVSSAYQYMLDTMRPSSPRPGIAAGSRISAIIPDRWKYAATVHYPGTARERITLKTSEDQTFCFLETSDVSPADYLKTLGVQPASASSQLMNLPALSATASDAPFAFSLPELSWHPQTAQYKVWAASANGSTYAAACISATPRMWESDPGITRFLAGISYTAAGPAAFPSPVPKIPE